MPIKKLFLAHYSGDATELHDLATELRIRGVLPWVDKQGGFSIGDQSEAEARRSISEDCFGFLLYATPSVFDRPFIRDVEVDQAVKKHQEDPSFAMFAVPRKLEFKDLQRYSLDNFKFDLSVFHTMALPSGDNLSEGLARIAFEVLARVLRQGLVSNGPASISLQFSTRELLPQSHNDVLCIDAASLFRSAIGHENNWNRLIRALTDVKRNISAIYGRPRIYVHGSKHLTSAFLFGRIFAPFELDIRQTSNEVWRTDTDNRGGSPFRVSVQHLDTNSETLFLEVASGYKNISSGVEVLADLHSIRPAIRLQLRPRKTQLPLNNHTCRAMVSQTYRELEKVLQSHSIKEIHMFAAVPQAYMMMLGREFRGMPPVQLYEWCNGIYMSSCLIPAGVF